MSTPRLKNRNKAPLELFAAATAIFLSTTECRAESSAPHRSPMVMASNDPGQIIDIKVEMARASNATARDENERRYGVAKLRGAFQEASSPQYASAVPDAPIRNVSPATYFEVIDRRPPSPTKPTPPTDWMPKLMILAGAGLFAGVVLIANSIHDRNRYGALRL